jgi:hypothetical protein
MWSYGSAMPEAAWRKRALIASGLVVVLAPALWHIRTLVGLFRARLAFPLDIEWMESGHLYHAYRIAHHLPIYADPARGFAAFPYPPFYWLVVAFVGRIVGLDYATGRFVSAASIGASMLVLGVVLVRRAPARWIGVAFAVVAAGAIGAGYPMTAGSYDLARTDALATFLPIAAAAVAHADRMTRGRALATAALLAAAIYTKQTGVFFAAWIIAFVAIHDRRSGLVVLATTIALCMGLLAVLYVVSDGWFWTWLFDMRHHRIDWPSWADPLGVFVRQAPPLVLLPPAVVLMHRRRWIHAETTKWLGVLGAAIVGAMIAHVKAGGWLNLYTPVFVLAWPVSLLVVLDLVRGLSARPHRALAAVWCSLGISGGLLLLLRYDPTPFVPTKAMWSSAQRFHAIVGGLDGDVVVATIPFAAVRDGKSCPQPIMQAYFDAANAGMSASYPASLDLSGARWVIVTGTWLEEKLPAALEEKFLLERELDVDPSSPGVTHPFPRTLWRRRAP